MLDLEGSMRTTVTIDDVLRAARHLAESKGQSLGQTLSELARASLTRSAVSAYRNGVRLFPVNTGAAGATMEEVTALRDALE
jgi:hypothetical protein